MLGPCQTCCTRRLPTPAARFASISTSHTARAGCAPADTTTTAQSSLSAPTPFVSTSELMTPGSDVRLLPACFATAKAASSPIRRQLLGAMGDLSDPMGDNPDNSPNSGYWHAKTPFHGTASWRDKNLNWVLLASQVCGFRRTGSAQGLGRGARGRQLCAALAGFGVGTLP